MAATTYTLSQKTGNLSAYTRLSGPTAQKLVYKEDHKSGLRRVVIKSTDLLKAMKEVSGSAKTYETNDVFAVLPVFKGELAEWAACFVHTADTNAANPTIGDSAVPAGWCSPTLNSAGGTLTSLAASTMLAGSQSAAGNMGAIGKLYTADDAVCVKLGSTLPITTGSGAAEVGGPLVLEIVLKYTQVFPGAKLTGGGY